MVQGELQSLPHIVYKVRVVQLGRPSWSSSIPRSIHLPFHSSLLWCKFLCGLVHPFEHVPLQSRVLCPVAMCLTYHHVSPLSYLETTSSVSTFTLDVSALLSSLAVEESHTVLIHFYGDTTGIIPTLEIYAEGYLAENYRIDHYEE